MNAGRSIVHLDLDTFFVSVERLRNSSLSGKPVIIGGSSDRGVVASCSYEARHFGVRSAMPIRMARQLCPDAFFLKGDYEQYSHYSDLVTEIIAERAPLFEKASIDEHYIDATGMERFFGTVKWAQELRTTIEKESGLPISLGLSINKTVAKMATNECKPHGEYQVPAHGVQPFLDPLSIRKIPMIGAKTFQRLRSMGVSTIATLRDIPMELLEQVLGEHGRLIWLKANGIDQNPVIPYSERKSIGTEHTFDQDTTDLQFLEARLVGMCEEIGFQMRQEQKLCSCVTVKLRYADFNTHTMQQRIPYTAFDHKLIEVSKNLLSKLYNRRLRIRLIGVRYTHLVHGSPQIHLFEDSEELINLYQAVDRMKAKYGEHALLRGCSLKKKNTE